MARVVKEAHRFTCRPARLFTNAMNHILALPSQPKLVLAYRPRKDERLSWPGHHDGAGNDMRERAKKLVAVTQ